MCGAISHAEQILYAYPDSALQQLEKLRDVSDLPDSIHVKWELLLTHARFMCNVGQTDSLLRHAMSYYLRQNDSCQVAQALYLQGALLQVERQHDRALRFFLKADTLKGQHYDPQLAYYLNMHISQLYAYDAKAKSAVHYAMRAWQVAALSVNLEDKLQAALQIARLFTTVPETGDAEKMYKRAIETARELHKVDVLDMAHVELASFYRHQGRLLDALSCLKESQSSQPTPLNTLEIGKIYREMGMRDSAVVYLEKAAESSSHHVSYAALEELSNMPDTDTRQALKFSRLLWERNDSIYQIDQSRSQEDFRQKYREQQELNRQNEIAFAKERKLLRTLVLVFLLLATFASIILFYQRRVAIQKRRNMQKESEINALLLRISENETVMSRNEALILELSAQMEQDTLDHEELQHLSAQLQEQNDILRLRILELRKQMANQTPSISSLQDKAHYLTGDDWDSLLKEMDLMYDDITMRLKTMVPTMTAADVQFCCLLKLGFSYAEIGTILNITPSSVAKRKLRLKAKMSQDPAFTADISDLECWLKEL